MRLIDADELLEHAYRDRLDSRELIANMIKSAPAIKEIPINMPLSLFVKALEQEPILDKIRAEIADLDDADYDYEGYYKAVTDALQVIDKYRQEG